MRHAATVDLFDRCGLTIVPAQVWRFIDAYQWVDEAIEEFLTAIGTDAALIRQGERGEIARTNDVLDLLVEIEGAFVRLELPALARIENAIFSRNYEAVRAAAEIVAIYEAIVALSDRWPEECRLATLSSFLNDVEVELRDPLLSTPDDARAAEHVASGIADLMFRFDQSNHEQQNWVDVLKADRSWSTWPEAGDIEHEVVRFAELRDRLLTQAFDLPTCAGLIEALEEINGSIASIWRTHSSSSRGRGSGGGHRGGHSSGSSAALSEVEMALRYFGFDKSATPTLGDFKKRKRALEKETYPPPAGRGSEEKFKEFGQHRDVLKRHFRYI